MRFSVALIPALIALSSPAAAVTMTLGGVTLPASGGVQQGLGTAQTGSGIVTNDFNSNASIGITAYGISRATTSVRGQHFAPKNDASQYAYLTKIGTGTIVLNATSGMRISYLGFYLGSVDAYNSFTFYNNTIALDITGQSSTGQTVDFGKQVTGTDIAVTEGGYTPAQLTNSSTDPSLFVNFTFSPAERVTRIVISQTDFGTEFDNLSYQMVSSTAAIAHFNSFAPRAAAAFSAVPEPGALAFAGLGFAAIAIRRRPRA